MAEFPFLSISTDAYLSDTRHFTAAQHGAYFLLLLTAWRTADCTLPDNDERLARWAAMDMRTWQRNKLTILEPWHLIDGRWCQGRLLDTRQKSIENINQKSTAGTASALKRKEMRQRTLQRNVNGISTNHNHNHNQEKESRETPAFEKWWEAFPRQRRGSKDKALSAYRQALTRATEDQIYEGTLGYAGSDEVKRGYAKGAAAWLNDDRWANDYAAKPSGSNPADPKPTSYERAILAGIRGGQG